MYENRGHKAVSVPLRSDDVHGLVLLRVRRLHGALKEVSIVGQENDWQCSNRRIVIWSIGMRMEFLGDSITVTIWTCIHY